MSLEEHFQNSVNNLDLSPTETVARFVKEYNIWAKHCHNLIKSDKTKLNEISRDDSPQRKDLLSIYKKYCTSKNRQYQRSSKGYFFYGGTYNSSYEIISIIEISKNKIEIQTAKIKGVSTQKKYTLVRQAQMWKIDSVKSLEGNNKWINDIL